MIGLQYSSQIFYSDIPGEIKHSEMGKMKTTRLKLLISLLPLLSLPALVRANGPSESLTRWLDDKTPEIVRQLPASGPTPEGVSVRRVVFRSRKNSKIFACIATPE
jgi:hypothetical protein